MWPLVVYRFEYMVYGYLLCLVPHLKSNQFKPSSKIFLLTVPRRCFFCGSFMLFLSCFCFACVHVCSMMPCGHLLGKGWPLGSSLWCLIVKLSLSYWYHWPCVVLDFIHSWSLPFFLLYIIHRRDNESVSV